MNYQLLIRTIRCIISPRNRTAILVEGGLKTSSNPIDRLEHELKELRGLEQQRDNMLTELRANQELICLMARSMQKFLAAGQGGKEEYELLVRLEELQREHQKILSSYQPPDSTPVQYKPNA